MCLLIPYKKHSDLFFVFGVSVTALNSTICDTVNRCRYYISIIYKVK